MKLLSALQAFSAALLFLPSSASAEESVAGWLVSKSPGKATCQMGASFKGGTSLLIRYDPRDDGYFVYIGNGDWRSLIDQKEYVVTYILRNEEWVDDETIAYNGGDHAPTLFSAFTSDFGPDLMISNNLVIRNGNKIVDTLSLKGTSKAVPALVRCSMREFAKVPYDPFE